MEQPRAAAAPIFQPNAGAKPGRDIAIFVVLL
jgi:hypothetical protein